MVKTFKVQPVNILYWLQDEFESCLSCATPEIFKSLNQTDPVFPGNETLPTENSKTVETSKKDDSQLLGKDHSNFH